MTELFTSNKFTFCIGIFLNSKLIKQIKKLGKVSLDQWIIFKMYFFLHRSEKNNHLKSYLLLDISI